MTLIDQIAPRLDHDVRPVRDIIRNFAPNWFTVTMGTGALALALNQLAPALPAIRPLATGLWLANIALFATFSLLYAARWVLFFDEARRIFQHPVMSMFFGAIPMGLATIVNGFISFGTHLLGEKAILIAHTLWWADSALSVACGALIPYLMFTRQDHGLGRMTAIWLMPVVAAEVAAASGGLLAPHLPAAQGFTVLVLGYALWAYSVPVAMGILVILMLRLIVHKLPPRDVGPSAWLALGPIGTGALGLVLLGSAAPAIFADQGLPGVGETALGLGVLGGLMMWGYGTWWLVLAALKTLRYLREGLPFNLGWWGFTFPLAVYTLATFALGHITRFAPFDMLGTVLVACLAGLWAIVAAGTLRGAWTRELFVAPCLAKASMPARFEADTI